MKAFINFALLTLSLSACVGNATIPDFRPDQEWRLCNLATDRNGAYYTKATYELSHSALGPRSWETSGRHYVEEAKRRNLYCPTDLPRSTPRMIPRASASRVPPVAVQPSPTPSATQYQSERNARTSSEARVEQICRRRADQARRVATNNHRPSNTSTRAHCRRDFFGNYDCSTSTGLTGGVWGGMLAAVEADNAGRDAYDIEYETCMIQLGN